MNTQAPKYPSSFFDDYPEYRSNVETAALEATHHTQHAVQACSDYFYYCKSSPIIAQVMASHPLTESAPVSGLKGCLDTFSAKVAELAADCRAGAGLVVENLMRDLDRVDPRRPQLADRLPRIVEPFVDKHWHEKESALQADIKLLFERVIWKPLQDIDESSPEPINPVQQAQRDDSDASSQRSRDDTPYPEPVEIRLMSAKPVHPIRPPLKASLFSCMAIEALSSLSAGMAVDDIAMIGMPAIKYSVLAMTHALHSRYLMCVNDHGGSNDAVCYADIDARAMTSICKHVCVYNIVTRDGIAVVFKYKGNVVVVDDREHAGWTEFKCRQRPISGMYVANRWCQQLDDDIYIVDDKDRLMRISWHDVKAGRYASHAVVDSHVEDFYVHDQGIAILKTTGTLVINGGQTVCMQAVDDNAKWSAVVKAADRWLVCGDKTDMTSTIVNLDDQGVVISSVSILTKAVYDDAWIKYLKTAIVRHHQAIILAIDVDACCHLISMTASGRLHIIDSMPSIRRRDIKYPEEKFKQITSMTETDTEGQYIVAGYMWIKKLTVRLN